MSSFILELTANQSLSPPRSTGRSACARERACEHELFVRASMSFLSNVSARANLFLRAKQRVRIRKYEGLLPFFLLFWDLL